MLNNLTHSYYVMLYTPRWKQNVKHINAYFYFRSGDKRGGFSIRKFAEKYKLGDPIAGNFYQAQYDDYVPILYKQLGA